MTEKDTITIRDGVVEDAAGISYVRVETWRTTYAGIVPDATLASFDHEKQTEKVKQVFREMSPDSFFVVAESDGRIVGYALAGAERTGEMPFAGELCAIYVLDKCQRRAIGRRLVEKVVSRLAGKGRHSMVVWCLAQNPYRRFYESLGGALAGAKTIEVGGKTLIEVAYGWRDTDSLQGA